MHIALTTGSRHADVERVYAQEMAASDDDALPPEGRDPNSVGGWSWWAKRVLEAAG